MKPISATRNFASKFSNLVDICDGTENLMISIYHLEVDKFLYCNQKFQNVLGCHCDKLLQKGWDFWFTLICREKLERVKSNLYNFLSTPIGHKGITMKYPVVDHQDKILLLRHDISLYKVEQQTLAISYFFDISEEEQIEQCLAVRGMEKESLNAAMLISSREKEILELIADGFSSKEIAERLFISNHTVISHRKHLIEKFKVKNTAQLIKEALKVVDL